MALMPRMEIGERWRQPEAEKRRLAEQLLGHRLCAKPGPQPEALCAQGPPPKPCGDQLSQAYRMADCMPCGLRP